MPARRSMPLLSRALDFALAFLLILRSAAPAWAWGRLGHRVIAKLAERHLTPAARAGIAGLLEPGESLADCSTSADEHRRELPKTAPWHYVDVPLDEPRMTTGSPGTSPGRGSSCRRSAS
jgi:S1/P1 Nuclease